MSHGEVKSDHLRPVDTALGGSWKSSSYEKVERGGGNVSAAENAQPMVRPHDHTPRALRVRVLSDTVTMNSYEYLIKKLCNEIKAIMYLTKSSTSMTPVF